MFVKPDNATGEVYDKVYEFDFEEEERVLELIQAVYEEISSLKFLDDPEVMRAAGKELKLKDIKEFIELLLEKNR